MLENFLKVQVEVAGHHPGHFLLTFNSLQYPITVKPDASVLFSDWLRRLQPVLSGQRDPAGELTSSDLLRNMGMWLWQALLPDSAPAKPRDTLAHALRTGHTPLLLTLPDTLTGLPWELLYDPEQSDGRGFLSRCRPLIRLSAKAPATTPIEPPLRVLLLISSPAVLGEDSRVDVESERAAVEQAVHDMREGGFLHLVVEDIVTPKRVECLLDRFKPHIIHYIGHGQYDQTNGGMLLWEDDQGNALYLSTSRVASLLGSRNLHAVVLHGCETARSKARAGVLGLAGTLAQEGLPAILAQQANLTYESSQLASQAWYKALTTGQSIAFALLAVRQVLIEADRPDWAVPILQGSAACLAPVLAAPSLAGIADPLLTRGGAAADVPTPTDVFVGRHRELRALHLMLEDVSGNGPVLAFITGPGGMGKSTLAIQAVTRYGVSYKAALMLHCQEYQSIDLFLQSIGEFLKRLGTPDFLERTLPDPKLGAEAKLDEAVVALRAVGPVLLIIDNLESMQNEDQMISDKALLYLLQALLTNLHSGKVLITGRYMVKELLMQENLGTKFLHISLDDLSRYETSQLLLRYPSLARLSEIVRQKLIQEFGGFPYVYDLLSSKAVVEDLEQIIYEVREYGTVKQKTITEERKQRTAEEWQHIRQEIVGFAALAAIVARLSEPARMLLACLSVLNRAFPLEAIEQGLGQTREVWQQLLNWSLLHDNQQEQNYHLHNITKHYAEALLDEQDRRQTQKRLATWYQHYAWHEHPNLLDLLEAHRLLRAAGEFQQAGELVLQVAKALSWVGLYALLQGLCLQTLDDLHESNNLLATEMRSELGRVHLLQGNYEKANALFRQNLASSERSNNQGEKATALYHLGVIAQFQGSYREAGYLLSQSLLIAELFDFPVGRALPLHHLGAIAQEQGDYQEAWTLFRKCLELEDRLDLQREQLGTLHHLAMIAQGQGNYQEAAKHFQQNLILAERLGLQREQVGSLIHLGLCAQEQGNYQEAAKHFLQALTFAEQLGLQRERVSILHNMGIVAQVQGGYQEATDFFQQSLTLAKQLGLRHGEANALHHLGMVARQQGNRQEARNFLQQSLALEERLGVRSERANTLLALGEVAQEQGNYQEARNLFRQQLTIEGQLHLRHERAIALHRLGMIAGRQGYYEEARNLFQQELMIVNQLNFQTQRASALYELGYIALHQQSYEEADDFFRQYLAIAEQSNDQHPQANALHQLGMIAELQGKLEEARNFYHQGLIIEEQLGLHREQVDTLKCFGRLATRQENYDEADRLYRQCLALAENLDLQDKRAEVLYDLGELAWEMGNLEEAHNLFMRSDHLITLYELGRAWLSQRRYKEAYYLYQKYLDIT